MDFAKVKLIINKVVTMRIRTAKAADSQFILKLSDQINRQHHQGAPNVFSSPDKSTNGSEAYWLGLMLEPEGHFLVAEEKDQIVAFLVGKITQNIGVSFIQGHKVARVNTIVVGDDAQGYLNVRGEVAPEGFELLTEYPKAGFDIYKKATP